MLDLHKKLTVNEIFFSIQGESWLAGLPCVFVRLTGCHQRCSYCDTEYAFYEGQKMTLREILEQVAKFDCKNLLLTGGEPLLQLDAPLIDALHAAGENPAGQRLSRRGRDRRQPQD